MYPATGAPDIEYHAPDQDGSDYSDLTEATQNRQPLYGSGATLDAHPNRLCSRGMLRDACPFLPILAYPKG